MKNEKVLIVIDIQREYCAPGRPFSLSTIQPSLDAAKSVLQGARRAGVPVIHVRHLQEGQIFNPSSEFSKYIEGFEPLAGEAEVTKGNFSCFSSPEFCDLLERQSGKEIVVIGYGSTMCCLSTILEGYHRGRKMRFIKNASLAKSTASFDEKTLHMAMTEVLAPFASISDSAEIIREMSPS